MELDGNEARKPLISKIIEYFEPYFWSPEEREYWLQEARRKKIKTDLQVQRIEAQKKKSDLIEKEKAIFNLVGYLYFSILTSHSRKWSALVLLEESKKARKISINKVFDADGHEIQDAQQRATVFTILEGTKTYLTFLRPWVERNLETEDLKKNRKKIESAAFTLHIVN